jgi:hypothetical protein
MMENDRPVGELINEFAELRAHLDSERKKFKELEKRLKDDMERLEVAILEVQRSLGVTSLSTTNLTAYQTSKVSVRVGDWDKFINFVADSRNFQLLEKRCAKLASIEMFDEDGIAPTDIGLTRDTEIVIQVRKK